MIEDKEIDAIFDEMPDGPRGFCINWGYRTFARELLAKAFAKQESRPSGIEAMVCEDIAKRQSLGISKYGTTVAQNPLELRAWLQHLYEEQLDACVYVRRAIEELDKNNAR